ncbi:hypothetical protein Y1Q_0008237 [Alligator mississippiensis]|uniref:Uncharacterized protein n=1 Tax=Alligator mississippiensis TaxID=8496 RepID=A0A151N1H2_ALLMI|nr:hypothetical protein Y1Q_0008237 [Alligator mississippiensis]
MSRSDGHKQKGLEYLTAAIKGNWGAVAPLQTMLDEELQLEIMPCSSALEVQLHKTSATAAIGLEPKSPLLSTDEPGHA